MCSRLRRNLAAHDLHPAQRPILYSQFSACEVSIKFNETEKSKMTESAVSDTKADRLRIHKSIFPDGKSRLIDLNEVCHRTGFAKSTVFAKVADKSFVQPIKVKKGVTRWLESEIDDWIDSVVEAGR